MEIQRVSVVQFFSTRTPFKTPNRAGKCGDPQHLQMKQCTALLCFLLAVCEAWLLHRNQDSLIHRGLRGKEKLLEQSPFLQLVVKSSDQSTLSPWASWELGTQASVLQWHRWRKRRVREEYNERALHICTIYLCVPIWWICIQASALETVSFQMKSHHSNLWRHQQKLSGDHLYHFITGL